jgi:UDPglucose 6-dehydrogenase
MEITVVGVGHVGLVSAVCLAGAGHRVRALDRDLALIERLTAGETPFLEPGLSELLTQTIASGSISFHGEPEAAVPGAELILLCVNTPSLENGHPDIAPLLEAALAVAAHATPAATIVTRSTAPVGTASYLRDLVAERRGEPLPIAVNPEFLAEGTAVRDFLSPDRVVIGVWGERDAAPLLEAYEPILSRQLAAQYLGASAGGKGSQDDRVPLIVTDPATAELVKYAANAFLAVKISFINEIASMSRELGADIEKVSRVLGLDRRIGPHFLRAGIGWGGSCFPKDIRAFRGIAETRGVEMRMLEAANAVNAGQRQWVVRRLEKHLKVLAGRRIGLLGLAFKPHTDDVREAPSLEIAAQLARRGARVYAFDPAIKELPGSIDGLLKLASDPLALARGADALVLVTDWPEFAELDLGALQAVMRDPLLIDGRNLFDPDAARKAGFTYVSVGR